MTKVEGLTFHNLYVEELNAVLAAEKLLVKIIPQFILFSSSKELREQLDLYLSHVQRHVEQMYQAFHHLNEYASNRPEKTILGFEEDMVYLVHMGGISPVKDALLIALLQRLIHYKIAIYGTARTYARHLIDNETMDMLQTALIEEHKYDRNFTQMAEGGVFTTGINDEALHSNP